MDWMGGKSVIQIQQIQNKELNVNRVCAFVCGKLSPV